MLVPIEKIQPHPNRIKADTINTNLYESIKELGIVKEIVVNKDYMILDGHQRYFIAKSLGYTELSCRVYDDGDQLRFMLESNYAKIKRTI